MRRCHDCRMTYASYTQNQQQRIASSAT